MTGQCPTPTSPSSENSPAAATPTPSPCPSTGSEPTSPPPTPTSPLPRSTDPESSSPPSTSPASDPTAKLIPLTAIRLDEPANARAEIDETHVRSLARDIAHTGLLNPITVTKHRDGYRLVAGANRYRAYLHLARPTIPARILVFDEAGAALARLAENVQRSNLSALEEANQLASAVERDPAGTDGIAEKLGRSRNWVEDRLELLAYPEELRAAVHRKTVSLAAAKHLAKIPDPSDRCIAIEQAELHGITARTARDWLRQSQMAQPAQADPSQNVDAHPSERFRTTTYADCFMCKQSIDIIQTLSVRMCHGCLQELAQATRKAQLHLPTTDAIPQPNTPPPHDDPPYNQPHPDRPPELR